MDDLAEWFKRKFGANTAIATAIASPAPPHQPG